MRIIYKGGQDVSGSRGESINFTRENYFILEKVPLPVFLVSRYIPRRNSLHPVYPWFLAEDSKITKNIEIEGGSRGVTVSTTYRGLKTLEQHEDIKKEDEFICKNFPWLLPAQDYKVWPISLEESKDCLYRFGKWEPSDLHDELNDAGDGDNNWQKPGRPDQDVERCRTIPFETTTQTKLTGTKNRTILGVSFWYCVMEHWFKEEHVTEFQETVNEMGVEIAGEKYEPGQVMLTEIRPEADKWERTDGTFDRLWKINIQLQIDPKTWWRKHENVATVFNNYNVKRDDKTFRPLLSDKKDIKGSIYNTGPVGNTTHFAPWEPAEHTGRIYCPFLGKSKIYATSFDPEPKKTTTSDGKEQYRHDLQKHVPYFGTKEECYQRNGNVAPVEVTDPMYLDKYGFMIWPDENTGLQTPNHWIEGYDNPLKDWKVLRLPMKR